MAEKEGAAAAAAAAADQSETQTIWFRSIKDYQANTTRLVPARADPEDDDAGCAWVFSRLFKTNSTDADLQPTTRAELLPHRFRKLSGQNLAHLVRRADHVQNLRGIDKHLADSAQMKQKIRSQCSVLREAFRNPRVAALHTLRKEMLRLSKKNKQCRRYSLVVFNQLNLSNSCRIAVIPSPENENAPLPFRCTAYDSNGSRQKINREVKSGWDIIDAARLSEYAAFGKERYHEMIVNGNEGVTAQVVCLCFDKNEEMRIENAEFIVPYSQRNDRDKHSTVSRPRSHRQLSSGGRSSSSSGAMQWLNDPENKLGRGRICDYTSFLADSAPKVAIIPLTYKWTLSRIFGILRHTREKLVIVEVQPWALSRLISSTDSTMLDELTVFTNQGS